MEPQNTTRVANINLDTYGDPLSISIEIPTGKTTERKMLPVFRTICGSIVDATVKHVEKAGRTVSCKAGCGACCRQMVPISPTEARLIKDLVEALPEPRRTEVNKRFETAKERMKDAGLLDRLRAADKPLGFEYKQLGLEYFRQGVPCPFLEDESCSIHPERPLVCREYLVVSPAENCTRQNSLPIESIKMPYETSKALTGIGGTRKFDNWVPLILAIEWAENHPEKETSRPGTDIAQDFFSRLLGKPPTGRAI